ncbi:MAG: helicase-associated domain-containing protein, partial [Anaerolineae bacterium]|nr:helicase-associated domain-containing protein [Anaerolineae bacterium]
IRDARSGEYLTGFEHWDRVEGALLVYLLSGPLHWLGVVSCGYKEGWEKPSSFFISPWGAAFLDLAGAPPDDLPPHPASISPDGVVTLPRETPLNDRFQLARIAEWRSSGAEYVYALTPMALGRVLSMGIEVDRIERFLLRISDGNVPAAALVRLRSWAERYGLVRLRRVAILETRTPQLMAELRVHERIRGYLRQPVSPTMVLVRESDWGLLIQELHRAGYLPEILR